MRPLDRRGLTPLFRMVYETDATYCEVCSPSLTMAGREQIAAEIARFDVRRRRYALRLNDPDRPI
ncbi:MAG: hypothetical protein KJZ87_26900, partial [Thermoguttaceae bacterium]|nr:hypothetical protein [Thermoguttaceae bacterium]